MSEFGKGFIYCLVNFAKHFDRALELQRIFKSAGIENTVGNDIALSSWINGASDHLFELEIPETLPNPIKEKIITLKNMALDYGHGSKMLAGFTQKEYDNLRADLNEIAIMIDEWFGIKTEKADWD